MRNSSNETSPIFSSGFLQVWYRWKAFDLIFEERIGTTFPNSTVCEIWTQIFSTVMHTKEIIKYPNFVLISQARMGNKIVIPKKDIDGAFLFWAQETYRNSPVAASLECDHHILLKIYMVERLWKLPPQGLSSGHALLLTH